MSTKNRTEIIKIRVTEEELAKAKELAALQGTTVSELFRDCILQQTNQVTATMPRQLIFHLGQIYTSIQGISQKLKVASNSDAELETKLEKVRNLINQLYHKLVNK